MAGPQFSVQVEGLGKLRRELKRAGEEFPAELRAANLDAAEIVAAEARRRAPRGPHEGGGAITPVADSIRALASQRGGRVAAGGARSPHAAPLEFGGTIPRFNSSVRTRVQAQPYLYPALDAKRDEVVEHYGDVLDELLRRAFP